MPLESTPPQHVPFPEDQAGQGSLLRYNPHMWNDRELEAIFVVRTAELERLTHRLLQAKPQEVQQHLLITGQRGMGKTTLLRRLALEVKRRPELSSRWLPVTFPEEQYIVSNLYEFWLNVLDLLLDRLESLDADPQELLTIEREAGALGALPPEAREEAALEILKNYMLKHEQGLLLLVDGTDQLFDSLAKSDPGPDKNANATTLWRLRKSLSHIPGFFWVGSGFQALESYHQYNGAFLDFFSLIELRSLGLEDMRLVLLTLAETFGLGPDLRGREARERMRFDLDRSPERLKALRTLTGGNPRTSIMLYDLFAAGSEADLRNDLNTLLDTMTPLYQSRMDNLSQQPRKIFAHLMAAWTPQTAAELGQAAGLAVNAVSAQLNRLENWGLVEKVATSDKKRILFQASERLFNIWYLMRLAPRRLRQPFIWLIQFMRTWFSDDELREIVHKRLDGHQAGRFKNVDSLEYSVALARTLPETARERARLEMQIFSVADALEAETNSKIKSLIFDFNSPNEQPFQTAEDYRRRFAALDEPLKRNPNIEPDRVQQWVESVKGSLFLSLGEKEWVAQTAADLSKFQTEELCKLLSSEKFKWLEFFETEAMETITMAVLLGDFFPDCPDSALAFKQIIGSFDEKPSVLFAAISLWQNKHSDLWLEKAYKRLFELDGQNSRAFNSYGNLLAYHLGKYDEAEEAYRHAIALDDQFAVPWNNLGRLLADHLGKYDEAEEAYRHAIALDDKSAPPWNNLGLLLADHLGKYDEAEEAYRRAIALDDKSAIPWNNLGRLLADHLGKYDEAEEAYWRAIALDDQFAIPWNNLGYLLSVYLDKYEEAEKAFRRAIALDDKFAIPWNRGFVKRLVWLKNIFIIK